MADPPSSGTSYFPYVFVGGIIRYNPQLIGANALAYSPQAGGGNPGSIAAYLDQFVPVPNSDLETVYTSLDFLNWTGFDPYIPNALSQISPECYGSLPFVEMRNSVLFANAILERYLPLRQCQENCEPCQSPACGARFWTQGLIDSGDQKSSGQHLGFDYQIYGAVLNADFQLPQQTTIGIAGSWTATNVHWNEQMGISHTNGAKGAIYASFMPSCFFIDGMLSGGFNWTSAHRDINFPIATNTAITGQQVSNIPVNRRANSSQTSFDLNGHLQAGYNFQRGCFWTTPLARISYFYERNSAFKEHGADSLNLNVNSFDNQDLRSYLGVGAGRVISVSSIKIIPQIQGMWVHDFVFNDREISANLSDVGGSFSVSYFRQDQNSFSGGAGLKILPTRNSAIFALYEIEVGSHFISNSGRLDLRFTF